MLWFYDLFFHRCPELGIGHLQGPEQWPCGCPAPQNLGSASGHSHSLGGQKAGDDHLTTEHMGRVAHRAPLCKDSIKNGKLVILRSHPSS